MVEAIFRAYRHVYLLGKDNKLRPIDLGRITSSQAGSIVELILRELLRCEEITDGVSPAKLIKSWPPTLVEWTTKAARDAFYSIEIKIDYKQAQSKADETRSGLKELGLDDTATLS